MAPAGPLPEAVIPFAERLFAWFPEVLVSLGHPQLADLYELPPLPSAQMRLEENGKYKLIQVKLWRLTRASTRAQKSPVLHQQQSAGPAQGLSALQRDVAASADVGISRAGHFDGLMKTEVANSTSKHACKAGVRDGRDGRDGHNVAGSSNRGAARAPASTSTTSSMFARAMEVAPNTSLMLDQAMKVGPNTSACGDSTHPAVGTNVFDFSVISSAAGRRNPYFPIGPSHDPGSPRLSSPGSHDPWDSSRHVSKSSVSSAAGRGTTKPEQQADDDAQTHFCEERSTPDAAAKTSSDSACGIEWGSSLARGSRPAWACFVTEKHLPHLSQQQGRPPQVPSLGFRSQDPIHQEVQSAWADSVEKPLRTRRALDVQMPEDWRRKASSRASSSSCGENLTPKVESPAVLCDETRTSKGKLHPFPGAFSKTRSIFVVDWDDTLCPTSWIQRILQEHMTDNFEWSLDANDWQHEVPSWFRQPLPDHPDMLDAMDRIQAEVRNFIDAAQKFGVVCIVTNAVEGWVQKTVKKWLPELTEYILGHGTRPPITVIYGQTLYRYPPPGSESASLGWVDCQGALTWWKTVAIFSALGRLDELYRLAQETRKSQNSTSSSPVPSSSCENPLQQVQSDEKVLPPVPRSFGGLAHLFNVISIGDNVAEMRASWLATTMWQLSSRGATRCGHSALKPSQEVVAATDPRQARKQRSLSAPPPTRKGPPWVKHFKLAEAPSVDDLVQQIRRLRLALPHVVASMSHLQVGPEELDNLFQGQSQEPVGDPVHRLQHLVRTQTV